jgi:IS30 family transposase
VDFATQNPLPDYSRVRPYDRSAVSDRPVTATGPAVRTESRYRRRGSRQDERDLAKKANQARQADLKRDTEKLLKLATELKESVDKTTESTLSLDVIKRAEEIEKLAHSVKDKMKAAY